jgi:hypothetical protein
LGILEVPSAVAGIAKQELFGISGLVHEGIVYLSVRQVFALVGRRRGDIYGWIMDAMPMSVIFVEYE